VLTSISKNIEENTHPFFNEQKDGKTLIILITSNRGLCGGYDSQIIKKTFLKLKEINDKNVDIITVGKKGDIAMRRINQNIPEVFTDMPDINIKISDIVPLSKLVLGQYLDHTYNKIYIAYTHFSSALIQKPIIKQLLPISKKEVKEGVLEAELLLRSSASKIDYLFEGDFDALISSLAEKITRMQIYQMFLESNASEQSSRMMAMKNASDASGEMIDDLTLIFNKARQANITREISEISAGMASVG
jgi:F-type H+-transporting ATPase subunit gamma